MAMNPAILVTGISGLLGNRVGSVLVEAGYDVIGTFYQHKDLIWANGLRDQVKCDLSNMHQLLNVVQNSHIEAIIHCAAMTNVDQCEKTREQAYRANVLATRNITRIARENDAKLIYISTASVFSGERGNYREEDTPYPTNYYSWTKLLGEEIVLAGCQALIIRSTIIGIHPKRVQIQNFLEWIVQKLSRGEDITLFDDIHINPLGDVTLATLIPILLERNISGSILHAGTRDHCSKGHIGDLILERYFPEYRGKVLHTSSDADLTANTARRAKQMWLNVDKVEREGIATMPSIEEELDRIWSLRHLNQRCSNQ